MGQHDWYGKQLLRHAAGSAFEDYGPSVELDFGAGQPGMIDGIIADNA